MSFSFWAAVRCRSGQYDTQAQLTAAREFGSLLGYTSEAVERMIAANAEV